MVITSLLHLFSRLQAKLKRAQRHLRLKEMAKKTKTVTSEEDDAPDSGEHCIRVGIQILVGEIFLGKSTSNSRILPDKLSNQTARNFVFA